MTSKQKQDVLQCLRKILFTRIYFERTYAGSKRNVTIFSSVVIN